MERRISSHISLRSGSSFLQKDAGESDGAFILRLFEAYYDRVYCFARKSAHPDVAEDIAQEVFIRLLQHPRLAELQLSCSYLIKTAHNLLRRRHSRWVKLQELLTHKATETRPTERWRMMKNDALQDQRLEEALQELKPEERDALDLIVCRGMTYEQAARSLNTTVTTINNRKYRGLQKLKHHLEDWTPIRRQA